MYFLRRSRLLFSSLSKDLSEPHVASKYVSRCKYSSLYTTNCKGKFKLRQQQYFFPRNLPSCDIRNAHIDTHDDHPKGDYRKDIAFKEAWRFAVKNFKYDFIKLQEEIRRIIRQDLILPDEGDRDVLWKFCSDLRSPVTVGGFCSNPYKEGNKLNPTTSLNTISMPIAESDSVFDGWIVTCDSDHNEGFSTARLSLSPAGHGLFSGNLCTQIPQDGRTQYAGYCNMRCYDVLKSFSRKGYFDWTGYTHIVIRCRGDGRSYLVNLATAGSFDVNWHLMYSYPLFTRGGPHWQVYKIPFSKFYRNMKGNIQDKQCAVGVSVITSVGISVLDKIDGPFSLEIDFIAVECVPGHEEEFAYEMYETPHLYTR